MSIDVEGFKQGQKAMWTSGDYATVALRIEAVGREVAERAGAAPGIELLDVQRERAAAAGVAIELVEGDAEQLPFADGSFDRVTSCFGVIFAPRHRLAAEQLVRVARPGGRIVVTGWTPTGFVGRTFQTAGAHMPAPPADFQPPVMWGTEQHVRELFAGTGAELSCELRTVTFSGDSAKAWFEADERLLGPAVMAKAALEPQGRYEDLRNDMLTLYDEVNEADDGSFRVQAEYLLTVAELPG